MLDRLRLLSKDAVGLYCIGVDIIFEGPMNLARGEGTPLGQMGCGRGQAHQGYNLGSTADIIGNGGRNVLN